MANKSKIEAKNGPEKYCFTMRNTLTEEKLKEKFESGDKEKIEAAVQEDEFEAKQKELEGVVNSNNGERYRSYSLSPRPIQTNRGDSTGPALG